MKKKSFKKLVKKMGYKLWGGDIKILYICKEVLIEIYDYEHAMDTYNSIAESQNCVDQILNNGVDITLGSNLYNITIGDYIVNLFGGYHILKSMEFNKAFKSLISKTMCTINKLSSNSISTVYVLCDGESNYFLYLIRPTAKLTTLKDIKIDIYDMYNSYFPKGYKHMHTTPRTFLCCLEKDYAGISFTQLQYDNIKYMLMELSSQNDSRFFNSMDDVCNMYNIWSMIK